MTFLLFIKGDLTSIKSLYRCFLDFSKASGLQANLGKSAMYFGGVPRTTQMAILNHLGIGPGELRFKYFGIILSTEKVTIMQWKPLSDKIIGKISSWTAKELSYAGRVQLVQTVLFGIQAL